MRIAVIVSTYNRPDALALVLDGYCAQIAQDFELIVADDGSTSDTRELVEHHARHALFPLHHVWQEDRGFRAGAARNRALATTVADYIIFSDGDCVPPRDFVRQHQRLAEPGYFLAGNRILLGERLTSAALAHHTPLHDWRAPQWLAAWARRDVNRILPLLRVPDIGLRKLSPARWKGVKTCNLSAWRADLARVNGFDETYAGWGLEDSDLVIRLLRLGVKHKSARFAAPLFHLWHPENDRSELGENRRRLEELLASQRVEAVHGLSQYG